MADTIDLLVVLVALSNNGDHIPRLRMVHRIKNGLSPVRDHQIPSAGPCHSGLDVFYDILILLKPRVVGGEDTEIRHFSSDLSHGVPPLLCPVPTAAKDAYQPLRAVIPEGG